MRNCGISPIIETIEQIEHYLEQHWAQDWSDYTGGSVLGLTAAGYLSRLPCGPQEGQRAHVFPLYRGGPDAVVFSVECDWNEEEEIIRWLRPVDFAREGETLVVVIYREDKGYSDVFRNERLKNYKKGTTEADA